MRPKENVSSSFHLSDLRNNTSEKTTVQETRSNLTKVKTISLASTVHLLTDFEDAGTLGERRHHDWDAYKGVIGATAYQLVLLTPCACIWCRRVAGPRACFYFFVFIYHLCWNVGVSEALSTRVVVYRILRCESYSRTSFGKTMASIQRKPFYIFVRLPNLSKFRYHNIDVHSGLCWMWIVSELVS